MIPRPVQRIEVARSAAQELRVELGCFRSLPARCIRSALSSSASL